MNPPSKHWRDIALPGSSESPVWELFHENSKISKFDTPITKEELITRVRDLWPSLPYDQYPLVELPREPVRLERTLAEALVERKSVRELVPRTFTLAEVGTLLHYGYGSTRIHDELQRPLRTVPSGGALYPLEIVFHASQIEGLAPGLYQYNSAHHHLRQLREGSESQRLASTLVQPRFALESSLQIFITAIFERTTFKYRDRGYRFALIEAGHVAQNLNLVATAMRVGCINVGGFFDRAVDALLGIDGISHSTLYIMCMGGDGSRSAP
jgi:SagB-type dehydrogenase family enzyme